MIAQAIDLDGPSEHAAELLLGLMCEEVAEPVVAVRQGQVWLPDFVSWQRDANASLLRDKGVYLITGGFGRMGTVFARHLARTRKARLILVGRKIDPRTVADLQALGAEVLPIAADVTSPGALAAALARGVATFGELNGVIHAAAVWIMRLSDRSRHSTTMGRHLVQARSRSSGPRGRSGRPGTSASSARPLHRARRLRLCCYAANHHLDTLAAWQSRRGKTRFISVDWDGWRFDGQDSRQIDPEQGIALFERILSAPHASRAVAIATPLQPRLDRFVLWNRRPAAGSAAATAPVPKGEWADRYQAAVAGAWEEFLGGDELGPGDDFYQLGGHSLAATQIVHRLRRELGLPVTLSMALAFPTLSGFAAELEKLAATADIEEGVL